ncbi:hypothetical protein Tco_0706561 [Tanacetum coccineum]|uniref:Uncharacterized protein n=1 Tax=Tanacetum coccineum TaxID=301880 RepID=A0ABQ4Y9T2_9ASTR
MNQLKEPTLQVVLDALKLTSFYKAFEITTGVPEIYMHEFWVTASRHHSSLRFKRNGKSHTVNVDNFRDMLQICPKLLGQKFKDPPFVEEILSFIRDLGHTSEIKVLSDVNVNHMHQPWRSFTAIINKCLSGKTTALENLVYQVENKNFKKNNDMCYPRFTKVIIDYFMAKDQSIPRRNMMFWHTVRDEPMFTTIKVISKHQDTLIYGAILPQHLTNQAMLKFEAYKTYHAYATGEKILKPKYVKNKYDPESSPKKKSAQASKGKRLKTSTKVAKPAKKKQPATTLKAKGLNVLSEVALSEVEQMKLATKRSKTQFHSSHASGSGANEGTGVSPGVPDIPTYNSEDEQISWKSSNEDDDDDVENEDDDGQDDDNEQTELDNDSNEFVHPKFSTHDEEERHDEEDKEEEGSDLRVQTPSHFKSTDDEIYDEITEGDNVEGKELDEEEEVNELYKEVNINLERRDVEMTDALRLMFKQSSSVSSGFISNMLNPNPDTGIDSILNLNTESTSLVDVLVTTNVEMPPSSVTTLPPPPIPHIQPQQQTHVSTPIIVPSTSLQNRPTFGSLFKFEDRVKSLEDGFSEFKQTNLFTEAVSSILGIVDKYLANKINEAVKGAVQLTIQQKNLYKALVDAYETNKDILEPYGDTFTFKRRRDNKDEDKEPSTRSNRGSKRRRARKELESSSAPKDKTSMSSGKSKEGSKSHQKSTRNLLQAEEPIHG